MIRNAPTHPAGLDRLPPADVASERALVGALLVCGMPQGVFDHSGDPLDAFDEAMAEVQPSDCADPRNVTALMALADLRRAGGAIDTALLVPRLLATGGSAAEWGDYLVACCEGVPIAGNAGHYARMVAESARRRRVWTAGARLLQAAHDGQLDSAAMIAEGHRELEAIEAPTHADESESIGSVIARVSADITTRQPGRAPGIPTGFRLLDFALGGLLAGEYIIIAARPSIGKSALALNMAMHIARRTGPVGFFSLEMTRGSLAEREMSRALGIDGTSLRRNDMTDTQRRQMQALAAEYADVSLMIDDGCGLTPTMLAQRATRMKRKHGIVALFVDYAQIMAYEIEGNENEKMSDVSKSLKGLAKKLNVPLIALSQLNRLSTQRQDKHPTMGELRSTGSLEQDADVVLLLHREDAYRPMDKWDGLADIDIAKNRNGPTRRVQLRWLSHLTSFADCAPESAADAAAMGEEIELPFG